MAFQSGATIEIIQENDSLSIKDSGEGIARKIWPVSIIENSQRNPALPAWPCAWLRNFTRSLLGTIDSGVG